MADMRLIDANALEKVLNAKVRTLADANGWYNHYVSGFDDAITYVEDAPTIDAVPVVHAYWMNDTYCSNCRAAKARPWAGYLEQNSNTFCHVCGAKMDKEE